MSKPNNPKAINGFETDNPKAILDKQRINHPLVLEKVVLMFRAKLN